MPPSGTTALPGPDDLAKHERSCPPTPPRPEKAPAGRFFHHGVVAAALALGALLIWGMLTWADRSMRQELQQQAVQAAQTIPAGDLRPLRGSRDDLANPAYHR